MSKYNLNMLGWFNFERLITTLLRQVIGPGISSFSGSSDQGRDATYEGKAYFPSKDNAIEGKWIFQVKFREHQNRDITQVRSNLQSTLHDEIVKITQKHHHDFNIYCFITNCPLTAKNIEEFKEIIESNEHITHGFVLGCQDIEELLDISPKVVRAFPQIMGIGQLQELVNWGINQRSLEYLVQVREDLNTFVVTKPYIQSLELLHKQHFCVITGAPKMGKSCTADAIAAAYVSDRFSVYDLKNQMDFYDVFNREEKQLFVCDDVFGDIALQATKKDEWTRSLNKLLRSLDNSHKLIWTARSYILKEALESSKILEDKPDFNQDTVTVSVENLNKIEKAMILYNHAKKANLPDDIKQIIRENCEIIVDSEYFAPESIRQLCTGMIVQFSEDSKNQKTVIDKVLTFLQSPGIAWQKAFKNSPAEIQYICVQVMAEGGWISYEDLSKKYKIETEEKGLKWRSFEEAFELSEGTFLKRKQHLYQRVIVYFYHPSMRDLLIELIQNDKTARELYIQKLTLGEFVNLITNVSQNEKESSLEHKILITEKADMDLLTKYLYEKVISTFKIQDILQVLSGIIDFIKKYKFNEMTSIGKQSFEEVVKSICKKKIWEKNYQDTHEIYITKQRSPFMRVSYYSDDQIDFWIDVLEKIKFTITNSPFNYIPEYIGELLEYFKENEERSGYWKLVALCNSFSGLLTTKYVNFANKEKAKCRLEDEIANAISECPEDYGDYEQCESWHQGYDYLLDEGNKFKEVFPKDELEGFEDFYNLAEECPYEPEPDYEPFDSYENEDFNIQEIFRDL